MSLQGNPCWTIVQTIISPNYSRKQDKLFPAAFRIKGRELSKNRKVIENGYNRKIEIEEPLFLYLDTIWKNKTDCRLDHKKLHGYVYTIGSDPAIMISYIFTWTVHLFAKFISVGSLSPTSIRTYRFTFPEDKHDVRASWMLEMETEMKELPDTSRLKTLLKEHFTIQEIGDMIFDLTGPILQGKNYDEVGSLFGSALAGFGVIIAECAAALEGTTTLKSPISRQLKRFRYGNGSEMDADNIHVDYMTSGGYVNHAEDDKKYFQLQDRIFYDKELNVLIGEAFDSKVNNNIPIPRPNVSLRPDWAIKVRGAVIVNGEAKSTDNMVTGLGPTAVISAQQFGYSDTALFMYMNNTKIRIVEMTCEDNHENPKENTPVLDAVMYQSPLKLDFGPRLHYEAQPNANSKILPVFDTEDSVAQPKQRKNGAYNTRTVPQKNYLKLPDEIVKKYEALHPQLQTILIAAFESTNVLANCILRKGDLSQILANYRECHENGCIPDVRHEPEAPAQRVIHLQNMWKYGEQSRRAWSEFFSEDERSEIREACELVYKPGNNRDQVLRGIAKMVRKNEEMAVDVMGSKNEAEDPDILVRHKDLVIAEDVF